MTETSAYILDPEKMRLLINTLRHCQGSFERELQGLDHFLQGTKLEMERHVNHIKEQKVQAEVELKEAEYALVQAEKQRDAAETHFQEMETKLNTAHEYVNQTKEERTAAYDNLNYQKESMQDAYHPEYNEVISACWDRINEAQVAVDDAYSTLEEAKKERDQAKGALKSAKHHVSTCTSKRDKANNNVQKWTSRIPEAKDLYTDVRLLLEDNYYATPSVLFVGGPDWKMTQLVDEKIPQSISQLKRIIKAIETYTDTPVSSLKPYTCGMEWDSEDVPKPQTDSTIDLAIQSESDSIYAEIRKGFKPNPAPAKENMKIRCRSCGHYLNKCRCRTINTTDHDT